MRKGTFLGKENGSNVMKLSKKQQEVIDLMNNGWELGQTTGYSSRTWLQKGGIGRGGEAKTISSSTLLALHKKRVIKLRLEHYPFKYWELIKEDK